MRGSFAYVKSEHAIEVQGDATEAVRQQAAAAAWRGMSDVQRTRWCLRSTRLPDTEQFRSDFGSLNGPDPNMAFTNPTTPGTEKK